MTTEKDYLASTSDGDFVNKMREIERRVVYETGDPAVIAEYEKLIKEEQESVS